MTPAIIEHLERHLGPFHSGWSESANGEPVSCQVVKFKAPDSQTAVFSTLGMSRDVLQSRVSVKEINQELILMVYEDIGDRNIPAILQSLAAEAVGLGRAFLRGDVIGPRGTLFDGFPFTAFYVTLPVYLPDSFQTFHDDAGRNVVFAWLVPIMEDEVFYIRTNGWERFEDLLEQVNPDLVDFKRPALI